MNLISAPRPDDPRLARNGSFPVGVRALSLSDPNRIDLSLSATEPVRGPRALRSELWYPAAPGTASGGTYRTLLRDGVTPITLQGHAMREATPSADGPFPLVIISHGYPGNRFLMAHFAEHLASHGYTVVAADHPQSTYDDQGPFGATLYHRPLDQAFLLRHLASDARFAPLVDARRSAVIGYSMGGYGALVFGGAGISAETVTSEVAPPHGLLAEHRAGSADHARLTDPRLRAIIAIGPWGMGRGVWDEDGLAGLQVPLMVMAGSADTISDYAAMRRIVSGASHVPRHLLTFENAGHNAAAPIPAPAESHAFSDRLGWYPFEHYADAVWDSLRMNAIARHFALAFLAQHLGGDPAQASLLNIPDTRPQETPKPAAPWPGFGTKDTPPPAGLRFESHAAQPR
ncbi:MAG: dienelactone hydrolase [Paracoccaceae bacterium]